MSSDQMKKMLMLVESCSCEQSQEVEEVQVNELGGKNNPPEYGIKITEYFGKIGDYGDEGYEYLDMKAPLWKKLFDYADGDISAIIITEKPEVLKQAAEELASVVEDLKNMYGDPHGIDESDFDAFVESVRNIANGQIDEVSAKKAFGAAGKRAAQAVGNLARAPIGAALSTGAAVAAGLQPNVDDAEAWLDRSDRARDKTLGVLKKAGTRAGQAAANLGRGVTKALGEEGEEIPNTPQRASFDKKEAAVKGITKVALHDTTYNLMKSKEYGQRAMLDAISSFVDNESKSINFANRANDPKWHEVWYKEFRDSRSRWLNRDVNSQFESQSVPEDQKLESQTTEDAEFQSFMETLNYVMKHK